MEKVHQGISRGFSVYVHGNYSRILSVFFYIIWGVFSW